jgi:hypothetical protein
MFFYLNKCKNISKVYSYLMNLTKKLNEPILKQINKSHRKFILNTQYGKLAILRPMLAKSIMKSDTNVIHNVINIDNSSSANYIKMVLKTKHDYLFFVPKSNFGNAHQIYESSKEKILEQFYGTAKKPNNPFEKCKNPSEIFHLSQNIKTSINKMLSRIGFMLFKTGEVNILHKESSILRNNVNIQSVFKDLIDKYEEEYQDQSPVAEKFSKHDFFVSCGLYEGIISSNSYITKGVEVPELGNRKVYPQYGVFNITRQDYISMFNRYLREHLVDFNFDSTNAIDLGCGTGILSFLLTQRGMKRVFAVDNMENAVLATQSNAQALGYHDKIKTVRLDIVQHYDSASVKFSEQENEARVKVSKGIKQIEKQKNYDELLLAHQ